MKVLLLLSLCALGLAVGCGRPVTEAEALQAAKDRFAKVCARFHYDPTTFDGPIKTTVGGAAFAYEWREKSAGSDFRLLITVESDGAIANVATSGRARPKTVEDLDAATDTQRK